MYVFIHENHRSIKQKFDNSSLCLNLFQMNDKHRTKGQIILCLKWNDLFMMFTCVFDKYLLTQIIISVCFKNWIKHFFQVLETWQLHSISFPQQLLSVHLGSKYNLLKNVLIRIGTKLKIRLISVLLLAMILILYNSRVFYICKVKFFLSCLGF